MRWRVETIPSKGNLSTLRFTPLYQECPGDQKEYANDFFQIDGLRVKPQPAVVVHHNGEDELAGDDNAKQPGRSDDRGDEDNGSDEKSSQHTTQPHPPLGARQMIRVEEGRVCSHYDVDEQQADNPGKERDQRSQERIAQHSAELGIGSRLYDNAHAHQQRDQ